MAIRPLNLGSPTAHASATPTFTEAYTDTPRVPRDHTDIVRRIEAARQRRLSSDRPPPKQGCCTIL